MSRDERRRLPVYPQPKSPKQDASRHAPLASSCAEPGFSAIAQLNGEFRKEPKTSVAHTLLAKKDKDDK